MNASLLEKMISYREKNRLMVSKIIIKQKIKNQFSIISKRMRGKKYIEAIDQADTTETLLLVEARAAREYWHAYGKLLENKMSWNGRRAHAKDQANTFLDIGYHYLSQRIAATCEEINLPTELGFFHKAQSMHARPFVYDYMEWLRPICVDKILLTFIGKKKKRLPEVKQKDIARFIYLIKKKFDMNCYHRKFSYCITLAYWSKIILLDFIGSVNENHPFKPLFPTLRNETRCKTKPPRKIEAV